MPNAEVGSAYVSVYPDTSDFASQLGNELSSKGVVNAMSSAGEKASRGFENGFSAVSVAVGNLMANAAMAAVDLFSQNLQRGIARLDTIQNFPKLMQTFGYSTEEASESILAIQSHLDGLPGSTDEVLRLVQAISDSTGSLSLATSTGLAFNDMLTASGADANTAMYATRMFDQMMGGAAFSAQRWMGIVSKMPLQMGMVAEYMLGAGATTSDLGDALKDGTVSMQDLAQAMTDLSPEFTKQARAMSYGVGTAMTNVQNRMGMGVAAILDAIGQTRIANAINDFSYGVRDAMVWVADGVEWLRRKILVSGIGVLFEQIAEKVSNWFSNIDWTPVKEFADGVITFIHDALQWILDNGDIVESIITGIGVAVAAMGIIGIIQGIQNALFGEAGLITALLANPFATIVIAIGAVVAGLVYFFTQTEKGQEMLASLKEKWEKFTEKVGSLLQTFKLNAKKTWENIKTTASNVWEKIKGVILPIAEGIKKRVETAWNSIKTTTQKVFNAVKSVVEPIWNSIKSIIESVVKFVTSLVKGDFEGMKKSVDTIFNSIKNIADTVWNGIKTVISGVVDGIKKVASDAWENMKTVASNAWDNISTAASTGWNNVKSSITKVTDSIKTAVSDAWENMKKTAREKWDAISSAASTAFEGIKKAILGPIEKAVGGVQGFIGDIQGFINGLTGKKVEVGVKDNRTSVGTIVDDIQKRINGVYGRTVGINFHAYQTGIKSLDIETYSTNSGRVYRYEMKPQYAAAGGIATSATLGIFGEAGSEALIPLSNRSKVRPFARAVAAEIGNGGGNVTVTGNTFYIRSDDDITRLAQELSTYQNRQMAGRL